MALLSVDIVTPTETLWSGDAQFVSAPAQDGSIGIFPRHQPLLTILGEGEVHITVDSGSSVVGRVSGGFLSVDSDKVTVVTDAGQMVRQGNGD